MTSHTTELTVKEALEKPKIIKNISVHPGAGAIFSDCGNYRFVLWRIWNWPEQLPCAMLIGLNPSTANASTNDPTITRITGLMKENGFGGFFMTNLYPFITPYPAELKIADLNLIKNDQALRYISSISKDVVFCWGNFKVHERAKQVAAMFPNSLCFGKNKNGSPKHPLYLPGNTKLVPFNFLTPQIDQ